MAASRTSSRVALSVALSNGRPRLAAARRPGPDRSSESSDGIFRLVSIRTEPTRNARPRARPVGLSRIGCHGGYAGPAGVRILRGHEHDPGRWARRRDRPLRRPLHRADDPEHRPAASLDARSASGGPRARRRGDHAGGAGDRLHAPGRRETRRVPRRAPGARTDEPSRLDQRVQQRARLDHRGRATGRHRGSRSRAVDPHDVRGMEPDLEPPDVRRLLPAGARRDDADLLLVHRARDGAGPHGVGDRRADAPLVRQGRRSQGRSSGGVHEAVGGGSRRHPQMDQDVRITDHGQRDHLRAVP